MDNVEDIDLIKHAWPIASHGAVLVTARDSIVSVGPAAGGLEIEVFNEASGAELMLKMIGRSNYSEDERHAAQLLCTRLGGLPLALETIAAQIRLRQRSIADFLTMYEKHSARLNQQRRGIDRFYKFSLRTCWQTAFDSLSPNASHLLAVIAFIAPDSIPEAMFKATSLPPGLEFCLDELECGMSLI